MDRVNVMNQTSFLPYAKQSISQEDIQAINGIFKEGWITRGPAVEAFEQQLAAYCGAKFAVLFNSGTTALQAACHAAQITPHDRVITTPNSFVATATAVVREGGSPIFVDIDPATGNLDLEQLAPNLAIESSRGRVILLPVHYAGIPVAMHAVERLIQDPNAIVIEDAAAALGSSYDSEHKVGSCRWSHMTVFSFHPAKLITTGEGGAVTTNDPELYHRLRRFRNNGIERDPKRLTQLDGPWYYEVHELTGNFNFTDFQAALGSSQLQRVDTFIEKRQAIATWYNNRTSNIPHTQTLPMQNDAKACPQPFVVRIDFSKTKITRSELMSALQTQGIGSQVHYIPIYRHPYFRDTFGDLSTYFPGMETFYTQALSLPCYQELEEEDVDRICTALTKALT